MNTLNKTVLTVLGLAISLVACNKGTDSAMLAKVNRTTITVADFKKQMQDLDPQVQPIVATDAKARKEFLDQLVGYEVAIQEAKRLGLDKEPEFKKRQDTIKQEAERRSQEAIKFELLANLVKKEITNTIKPPTDPEIKDYYNKNIEKMRTRDGKKVSLKDAELVLKDRIYSERQRDAFVEYVKNLKAKAKITVDEKALDKLGSSLLEPSGQDDMKKPAAAKEDANKNAGKEAPHK